MTVSCHCGTPSTYSECCEPFITGTQRAPTAETLMRSRYSAFCEGATDYLLHTRHPSQRARDSRKALQATINGTQWRRLQVVSAAEKGDKAEVEFVAFYTSANEALGQIHERSQFCREDEQWYYLDGVHLPPIKPQRNEPCWCGSGKKFKKCCGA